MKQDGSEHTAEEQAGNKPHKLRDGTEAKEEEMGKPERKCVSKERTGRLENEMKISSHLWVRDGRR